MGLTWKGLGECKTLNSTSTTDRASHLGAMLNLWNEWDMQVALLEYHTFVSFHYITKCFSFKPVSADSMVQPMFQFPGLRGSLAFLRWPSGNLWLEKWWDKGTEVVAEGNPEFSLKVKWNTQSETVYTTYLKHFGCVNMHFNFSV